MDEANYFPKLNRPTLISLAAGWASGFEGVNKISLHHYIGDNSEHRYALLFSLDGRIVPPFDQSPGDGSSEYQAQDDSSMRGIIWESFIRTPSFRDVYADGKPPSGYEAEWLAHPIFDGEAHPSFASDKSWQLYPDPVMIDKHSEEEQPERSKADLSSSRVGTDEISEIKDPDAFLDGLELPPLANDPYVRDGIRQLFVKTYGRTPSRKEIDHLFAQSIMVSTGTETVTFEEMESLYQENTNENNSNEANEPADPSAVSQIGRVNMAGEPQQMQGVPESKRTSKPRVSIVNEEAASLRRDNPSMDKVKAKKRIDFILENHNYSPYGRTQFNRIIEHLGFPPAPRGRKPTNKKK